MVILGQSAAPGEVAINHTATARGLWSGWCRGDTREAVPERERKESGASWTSKANPASRGTGMNRYSRNKDPILRSEHTQRLACNPENAPLS